MYAAAMIRRFIAVALVVAACGTRTDDAAQSKPPAVVDFKAAMQALCDAYPETGLPSEIELAKRINNALTSHPNADVVRFVASLSAMPAPDRTAKFKEMVDRAGIAVCRSYEKGRAPQPVFVDGVRALCDAAPDALRAALDDYKARAQTVGEIAGLWELLAAPHPNEREVADLAKYAAYAGVAPCKLADALAKK